jgi:copper chaperone
MHWCCITYVAFYKTKIEFEANQDPPLFSCFVVPRPCGAWRIRLNLIVAQQHTPKVYLILKEVNLMSQTILKIEGMTCGHCKMAVEKALKAVPGVTTAQVDLAEKKAAIEGSVEKAVLAKAVEAAGYKVVG